MMRGHSFLAAAVFLASLTIPAASYAALPLTRPQILLWRASAATELRQELRSYADSAANGETQSRLDAGEAQAFLGSSYEREGKVDSAIASYRRAVILRGDRSERMALVDLLLTQGTAASLTEARRLLAEGMAQMLGAPPVSVAHLFARQAWAQASAGQADSALATVLDRALPLSREPQWAKRFSSIALDAGRTDLAWRLALPVAVRSRGTDTKAMELLRRCATTGGPTMDVAGVVARETAKRDTNETRLRAALGAKRLTMRTADGFPLTVTFVAARSAIRPRVAILIAEPSDTLAAFDSLAVQLARQGAAVAIIDPRGARGSVAASAPGTDVWIGRERAMIDRTAQDAKEALDALVRLRLVDAHQALIGATGSLALAAARAAALDSRFAAVLLIAPSPAAVDRGALRASLAASTARLFVQVAPEEIEALILADRLAEALPIQQTRVADTGRPGHSAAIYRTDAKAVGRLLTWWKDVPSRRPATPPSPRR